MSIKHYQLRVKEVKRETPDAVSVHFEQPSDGKIIYKSGQFLTLLLTINGQKVRRAYSLCSSPDEAYPAVGIKAIPNGLVSNYVNTQVKAGDVLEILEPMGNFCVEPNASNKRHIVLFGGGSGITPLYSIAKTILKHEPQSKVTLIYGNRDEASIIFKKDLENLKNEYAGRFTLIQIVSNPADGWNGHIGMMLKSTVENLINEYKILSESNNEYYMCGPEPMMSETRAALDALGIAPDKIFKESFTSAAATEAKESAPATASDKTKIKLLFGGEEHDIEVGAKETILEAGLDAGLDLPYSCQSGVCTACRGRKKSGEVKMDETEGLSKKEIEQGYVLVCVGHPLTDNVVIEIP